MTDDDARLQPPSATLLAECEDVLDTAWRALDDWLHIYASDLCDEKRVAASRARINELGTVAYIAGVNAQISALLAKLRGEL
jgi:hypothetical protein